MTAHSRHNARSWNNDAHARYSVKTRPIADNANTYAATFSPATPAASAARPFLPAVVGLGFGATAIIRPTTTKKMTPRIATGTPMNEPYRLRYACVQLTVVLTSQKLV